MNVFSVSINKPAEHPNIPGDYKQVIVISKGNSFDKAVEIVLKTNPGWKFGGVNRLNEDDAILID